MNSADRTSFKSFLYISGTDAISCTLKVYWPRIFWLLVQVASSCVSALTALVDEEGSDISNVDTVLKEYGITLRDAAGQFRDISDVLNDLNAKWGKLDSAQKSELGTTIAGKQGLMLEYIVIYKCA